MLILSAIKKPPHFHNRGNVLIINYYIIIKNYQHRCGNRHISALVWNDMAQRILPPEAGPVWLSQLYSTGHWQLWGFSVFQLFSNIRYLFVKIFIKKRQVTQFVFLIIHLFSSGDLQILPHGSFFCYSLWLPGLPRPVLPLRHL